MRGGGSNGDGYDHVVPVSPDTVGIDGAPRPAASEVHL
jgi:hypothetical protein